MTYPALYPLLLNPVLHSRVWGGDKLQRLLGKIPPDQDRYGESWEVHDTASVANGPLAGQTIRALVDQYGAALIGEGNNPAEGFPLLVKFLDASQWLSIQVHPNDEQAKVLEGDPRGKTEAWVVIQAEEGAQLIHGVKAGHTREEMAQAIRENTLEQLLVYSTVHAGDVLFVAANTVHALGAGLLIYEIQQSSDITYRLYDYGRLGLDGKPRQLHIEKGTQVSNVEFVQPITHPDGVQVVSCPYFVTERYQVADEALTIQTKGRFHALSCIEGSVTIHHEEHQIGLATGQSAVIPAALADYQLTGQGVVLNSFQP